jgi:hypothetical protein
LRITAPPLSSLIRVTFATLTWLNWLIVARRELLLERRYRFMRPKTDVVARRKNGRESALGCVES